jgi:transcriptional regulator with XRE-family HTH domain
VTRGDSGNGVDAASPLKAARLLAGWSQASAMRRFRDAASAFGVAAPEGASLRRMFAYWESGEREVSVPAYRDAFCAIYGAPPEALGFAPRERPAVEAEGAVSALNLVRADDGLLAAFESLTHDLRLVDRRLGSAARAMMVDSHAEQIESVLHRCVGGQRPRLAAALAEAAALAGWLALDRCDINAAWQWHELGRGAASESGSAMHVGHVLAQQAVVLLDAGQVLAAQDTAQEASRVVVGAAPPAVQAWVAASEAEVLSGCGDALRARRRFDDARALFARESITEVPFIMLSDLHLERWHGHCLTRQGNPEAMTALARAGAGDADSVRAATSLHADMAAALLSAGECEESAREARLALGLAERCGSARHARRLRAILAGAQCKDVQQADEGP